MSAAHSTILCAALGPSREEALAEAMEAFADTGADSASEDDIREVLRNAQYDELSELPRDLYKQRGYNPASGTASMAVEIAGIVALGAAKQYAADFYVSFKDCAAVPIRASTLVVFSSHARHGTIDRSFGGDDATRRVPRGTAHDRRHHRMASRERSFGGDRGSA